MNPAFIILVIIGVVCLWFLLSFMFHPLGKYITKILQDTSDIINDEEKENNE